MQFAVSIKVSISFQIKLLYKIRFLLILKLIPLLRNVYLICMYIKRFDMPIFYQETVESFILALYI